MKIKYVHFSEPNKTQIYNTKVALKKNPFIKMSQEEFDEFELSNMERDKQQGHILSYEIIDEDNAEEYLNPPCKIGDTLYDISDFLDNRNSPEIDESKCRSLTLIGYKEKEPLWYVNGIEFTQSDIGVRIFLSKTDAITAIEAHQKSQKQNLTM